MIDSLFVSTQGALIAIITWGPLAHYLVTTWALLWDYLRTVKGLLGNFLRPKILKWKVRKFPTKNYSRQNVQYCWYVVIFSYSSFWRLKLKASEFIGVLVHLSLAIQFWFPSEPLCKDSEDIFSIPCSFWKKQGNIIERRYPRNLLITYFYEQNSIRGFWKVRSTCFAVEKTPAKSKAYNEY